VRAQESPCRSSLQNVNTSQLKEHFFDLKNDLKTQSGHSGGDWIELAHKLVNTQRLPDVADHRHPCTETARTHAAKHIVGKQVPWIE
jgi:hypothetical protein